MASEPVLKLLSAEEFLRIDFGPDIKAELDNGVIRMMAGGTGAHARVQANILTFLRVKLRGTGCRPFGSDMASRTHDMSVRYPDVTVFCGRTDRDDDRAKAFDDPRIVFEVLSESTASYDQKVKLEEYKSVASLDAIVFVDPDGERVRLVRRTGPEAWAEAWLQPGEDVALPTLDIVIPQVELFARD